MLRLDSVQTAAKLPYTGLVSAIARAARELTAGALSAPERLVVRIDSHATLLCMPAVAADVGITKVVTVHQQNAAHGLPAIQGEVIVFDAVTGRRLMQLDGPTLTARRTAAVSLLAIEKLARNPPRTALLIGTGFQAAAHVEALADYFGISSFWIAGRELESAIRFCERIRSARPIHAVPLAASALAPSGIGTDLVIALTTSRSPVVPPGLPDDTLAIGIGAFRPDMAELPPELLHKRRIVVDYRKGAEQEAGDLLQANVKWTDVSDLDQLLNGSTSPVRTPAVFKSVGHASWDLAAARVALQA